MSLLSQKPFSDLVESISALIEQVRGKVHYAVNQAMVQFYFSFPNHYALRSELTWTRELERERANGVVQLNNKDVDDE